MSELCSLIIFFNCEQLPESQRLVRSRRLSVIEAGVAKLEAIFPGLEFGNRNASAGSVDAMVPAEMVGDLSAYLDRHSELGSVMFDAGILRAARD
jgi:hypothetical protein